ncbi:MAG: YfjI family protein [Gallionellaceae bacterium]
MSESFSPFAASDKRRADLLQKFDSYIENLEEPSVAKVAPVTVANSNGWNTPQPLIAKVEPESYPIDALPDTIRAAVEEVAAFVKAPVAMVASSALAALSLAAQAHVDVRRADKLQGPVSLDLLTIADSGERKSTCDGFFVTAIRDYEIAQSDAAKPLVKDYVAALHAWESMRDGIRDKIRQLAKAGKPTNEMESALCDMEHKTPVPPKVPRLLYTDVTPESLAQNLAKKWPSGGVVSAEGGLVFGAHGMSKDSVMRNLGLLNQLWDGNPLTIDRKTSDSFMVRGVRLTIALQVQEPTLREFFDRSGALARGTGFLARFLVAWPDSTQGFRPFTEAPSSWPHLAAFNRRIDEILNHAVIVDDDGTLMPDMLSLSPEAKTIWIEYHNAIESELASGGELFDVRDVASKSADNAVRLAALFHVFCSTGSKCSRSSITADEMERASRIAAWHLNESRRFFGEIALPIEMADAARLDSWLIKHCRHERTHCVGKRYIRQYGPLRERDRLDVAVSELVSLDRIQVRKEERQINIWLNAALLAEGGAA